MPAGFTTRIASRHSSGKLRKLAKDDLPPATVKRMRAIANALDGMDRQSAVEAVGLERQALRDAITR